MRSACQRAAVALVLAGCGGTPGGQGARSAGGEATPAREASRHLAVGHLRPVQARGFLAAHREALALDVRDRDEWIDGLGHLEGARQIPLADRSRLNEIEAWKGKPIIVVCRVGGRSQSAAERLLASGYREVMNLEGGTAAWRESERAGGT